LNRLDQGGIDLVLLDLTLPDAGGIDTFLKVHAKAPDVPVVVMSGLADEELAVRAVGEGAQDYLMKGQVDSNLLVRAMRYAVERHRMLKELERVQKEELVMKDCFLSHVSHELRSPLTAIYQFVTIMLDGLAGELTPDEREYLEITLRNVVQLRDMIEDLLQVTRAREGRIVIQQRCAFLAGVAADTVDTLKAAAGAKGIELSDDVPADLSPVYIDIDRVREVLINLVDNAIKFTPEQGKITIRAWESKEDHGFICVAVSDTGCGIRPEDKERLFNYLYQGQSGKETSRKGLGLGLYICRQLLSLHGGRIWVESEPGKGSTFYFTLPVCSLASTLSPIMTAETAGSGEIALVTVEAFPVDRYVLAKSDEPVLSKVWDVLKKDVVLGQHALLPRMAWTDRGEVFFVATSAKGGSAEELESRIREDLALCDDIQGAGLGVAVSLKSVAVSSTKSSGSTEKVVDDVAHRVEELVRSTLLGKEKSHGQEEDSHSG
jgi:signal transduction histidine kinase